VKAWTSTVQFTTYVIQRDHANNTGWFVVNVPESRQRGAGFQVRIGPYVVGVSVVRVKR
jgi:mRNA-degrading endonuclease toxin of MazEF toxin-antitoxin module